ncbi:Xylose import ATP-binding protein XylG [Dyadobacter sp. CECT 9275]|uniref:Xylose import ATP-binding protein XylG n=1 Tax=Dyadobacter helix TaxID=2822344 RepID=A0A916NJM0_9BACT|nr:sugar ABC transporter ATP-binding protein [Dyadobacter sp. CECT 9275]CAG4990058.1 Xylose import ATP-binding protein XylG [Dyadobacter sp. CECT 9275]
MPDYILQITHLSKSFSGTKALDDVRLDLKRGEVHALMGENGAGKSTFMKILIGMLKPDSGSIILDGEELKNNNVNDILKKGISMIHQELLAVPELTVAQNIFLGREKQMPGSIFGWLHDGVMNARAGELLRNLELDISPSAKMKYLSVAETQMVEIAKAVSNKAKVIIMDEPTSAISDKEVASLFRIIADLKRKGVSVIYISHKMDEIFRIADTVTILRDGKYVTSKPASELSHHTLIAMMVGREITQLFPETPTDTGKEVLSVRELSKRNHFQNISFQVQAGEILGIAGLMGAGRTEIARVIYGLDRPDSGSIYLQGEPVTIKSPAHAILKGIGYVSEDRKVLGFVPAMSVKDNITLSSLKKHKKGLFINTKSEAALSESMVSDLRIKTEGINKKVKDLSGGNQQKVVIAKVLQCDPQLIILDEPTRGVDIGAKFEIYKLINSLKREGKAIIMISSELPEILGMSDRILVLSKGKQTALLAREEASEELIMQHAVQ